MDFYRLFLSAIALLVGITVHEFAHAWVAFKCGDYTAKYQGRVSLNPIVHLDPMGTLMIILSSMAGMGFGWGKPVPVNPYHFKKIRRDSFLVSIAGITANLITAVALVIILRMLLLAIPWFFVKAEGIFIYASAGLICDVIYTTIYLNVALIAFNVLPIPPLDGSGMLEAIVPDEYSHLLKQYFAYGPFILIIIVLFFPQLLRMFMKPVVDTLYAFINFVT